VKIYMKFLLARATVDHHAVEDKCRLLKQEKQLVSNFIEEVRERKKRLRPKKQVLTQCTCTSPSNNSTIKPTPRHSAKLVRPIHGFWSNQNSAELSMLTGFSTSELCHMYNEFLSHCSFSDTPFGISLNFLRRGLPLFSVEDDLFLHRIFKIVDANDRGLWKWEEYLFCLTLLLRSSRAMKAYFLFRVHDIDEDNCLSRDELLRFFCSSLHATVDKSLIEISENAIDSMFARIDTDGNGFITLEEVLQFVHCNPDIRDSASIFGRTLTPSKSKRHWRMKFDDDKDVHTTTTSSMERLFNDLRQGIIQNI